MWFQVGHTANAAAIIRVSAESNWKWCCILPEVFSCSTALFDFKQANLLLQRLRDGDNVSTTHPENRIRPGLSLSTFTLIWWCSQRDQAMRMFRSESPLNCIAKTSFFLTMVHCKLLPCQLVHILRTEELMGQCWFLPVATISLSEARIPLFSIRCLLSSANDGDEMLGQKCPSQKLVT